MLHPIAGRLGKDPEVKLVNTKNGETQVSNNTLYLWTNQGEGTKDVPLNITAWGDEAKTLEKYKKGDIIHFVGKPTAITYKPEGLDQELTVLGYEIKKIDENKLILTASNRLLEDFVKDRQIGSQEHVRGENSIKRTGQSKKTEKTKVKETELEI